GSLGFSTAATPSSNVGSYAVTGSGLTANNGNYVFTQAPANAVAFAITPATITVSAVGGSSTYGGAPCQSGDFGERPTERPGRRRAHWAIQLVRHHQSDQRGHLRSQRRRHAVKSELYGGGHHSGQLDGESGDADACRQCGEPDLRCRHSAAHRNG